MTERSTRLGWLPAVLVGASAAVVAEVAVAMLLYGGAGFMRSLTTVLAVEGVAFGAGLWTRPAPDAHDLVDRLRKRWLVCLFAFLGAALFGTAWSLLPEFGATRLGQGAGLALVGALPLVACGAVLAGMSALAAGDPGRRLAGPGAAAAVGAALGFVLTGYLLPRVPTPASLLIACLVMLSLGGMIYGGVLAARTEIQVLARRPGRGVEVRVEERRVPLDDVAVRDLLEGEVVRRSVPLESTPTEPWDVVVARARAAEGGHRVLVVGGGASSAPKALLRDHPEIRVEVLERAPAVVELGREHFDTDLAVGGDGRISVSVGNLDDAITGRDGSYDLVIIDAAGLATIGGVVGLSTMARRRLPALVGPDGWLAWGPDADGFAPGHDARGWRWFRVGRSYLGKPETVVLALRGADASLPSLPGFREFA